MVLASPLPAGRPGVSGEVQVWNLADGSPSAQPKHWIRHSVRMQLVSRWKDDCIRVDGECCSSHRFSNGVNESSFKELTKIGLGATVFTVSSEHLLSAGRDMTVKLTEVATERFIDNVTSITPGVLRGGVNALARHPSRDEILVGGSDGSPKLYRVFRQTARVIGDDANLVRKLPDMPGRIFSVAISPDAKYMAAASTLDGHSQIRVWKYDVEGQIPEDIKAMQSKHPSTRTPDEKKKLEAYVTPEPADVATWQVDETAIYAISLDAQGRLLAGGADGKLRVYDCATQQPVHALDVTPKIRSSYRRDSRFTSASSTCIP